MSIVNWVKQPSSALAPPLLDGQEVDVIGPSLRSSGADVSTAAKLDANAGRCFYGPIPAGKGFILANDRAERLLAEEPRYRDVVRPYLVGEDIATSPTQGPSRYIIDFGLRTLEEAMEFPRVLEIAELLVRPDRMEGYQENYRAWWRFARPLPGMRRAIASLDRYIAGTATGKRILFAWQDAWTCPSNLTNVFAFDDDYAFGVLTSAIHTSWAKAQSSTLKGDIRYTPTSAFETFPWPTSPTPASRARVADFAARLAAQRSAICLKHDFGLTRLYNLVDDGAFADLRQLHRALDEAVAVAYDWPVVAAHDSPTINRRLLELNRAVTTGEVAYGPFG